MVAPKDDPDKPEGFVIPFVYPNGTGWVGFFCINKPFRGRGWGATLFQAGLDHFAANGATVVGLDAVEEQVGTYGRRGFVDKSRIRLMIREGLGEQPLEGGLVHPQHGQELFPLHRIRSEVLTKSDLEHSGLERPNLWTEDAMFSRSDAFGFALVKGGATDELEGWILVRNSQDGFRFGPLYAKTKEGADLLLRTAMKRVEKEKGRFIAEVWPQNPEAVGIFEGAGWKYAGMDYYRMWLNGMVPKEQQPGGLAEKQCFAIFDAGEG
jgi:ribosomal protein S18 acetylase RimI-like enzyme